MNISNFEKTKHLLIKFSRNKFWILKLENDMKSIAAKYNFLFFLMILTLTGCLKTEEIVPDKNDVKYLQEAILIPDYFDFSTTKDVSIELKAPKFLRGAVFDIYLSNFKKERIRIATGTFDKNNVFSSLISIPVYIDSIQVVSRYFGLEKEVVIPVIGLNATYDYNVHYPYGSTEKSAVIQLKSAIATSFSYMGSYTANGYPNYLFKVNDHAWESLLSNLNQTLPEGVSVVNTKPQFIAGSTQTNLVLKQRTKVYVTFAGEGTNQKNALGYFIYNSSKPTNSELIIIYPNASAPGSGGSLHSGDQVLLGEFSANTTIGWFLVPDGWNKNQALVVDTKGIYYSVPSFNPESGTDQKPHMVFLKDIQNEVIVLGFEDTPRNTSSSDDDFNDAVFYITLDNLEAADLSNVLATVSPVDTDGDGVIDSLDEYPLDPTLAFNNATTTGSSGSLAFEDLWPSQGDFDFNDLVIEYNFNPITDVNNLVKILEIQISVNHIGASFHNGFAFEIPVSSSSVNSVTGSVITKNYLDLGANGTENGLSEATIFAFDDGWAVKGKSFPVRITFNNPVSASSIGTFFFNFFLVVNGDRGREIHLADKPPTFKANYSYFGQNSDYSNPSAGRFYRTKRNMPWAINIPGSFAIPIEKSNINKGYLKFVDWAESAGNLYPDWYLDATGYRDPSFLY